MTVVPTDRKLIAARPVALSAATLLVLSAVCGVSLYRSRSPRGGAKRPQECVWRMAQAAQQRDVEGYLACFTGSLYDRLRDQALEQPEQFARRVQAGVAELTGLSVLQLHFPEPDRAELVVERVFPRFNERQRMQLRRVGSDWRIERLEAIERHVPEISYGAPVMADAPAGAPAAEADRTTPASGEP